MFLLNMNTFAACVIIVLVGLVFWVVDTPDIDFYRLTEVSATLTIGVGAMYFSLKTFGYHRDEILRDTIFRLEELYESNKKIKFKDILKRHGLKDDDLSLSDDKNVIKLALDGATFLLGIFKLLFGLSILFLLFAINFIPPFVCP